MDEYKSILVHLDDTARCGERVGLAARIAEAQRASLFGMAPSGWFDWSIQATLPDAAAGHILVLQDELRARAHGALARFTERCRGSGIAADGAVVEEDAVSALVHHGHAHDLVVLGQPERSAGAGTDQAIVEQVLLRASRPLLLVPYAGRFESVGRDVLVAWDGSRGAARAASDALPLLRHARRVHLVEFGGSSTERLGARTLPLAVEWARRHGIPATPHDEPPADEVGEALLSRAADLDVDLIVMGAYGHSRWRELVLGGATRTLLASMTVPVLMAH